MKMFSPKNLAELMEALPKMGEKGKVAAGCTDIAIALKEGRVRPSCLLNVLDVEEMRAISPGEGALEIGAAVPFSEIASAGAVREYLPALSDAAAQVGSTQIRNRGTIGGNIGSASPAGDMLPVMLLCGAILRVADASGEITKRPFASMLTHGRVTPPANGQVIVSVLIPAPSPGNVSAFVKLGSRTEVTIAKLSVAMSLNFNAAGRISSPIITLGALARTPIFAKEAMAAIEGCLPDESALPRLSEALVRDVEEAIPGRYSLPYKRHAVRGTAADVFEKTISRRTI